MDFDVHKVAKLAMLTLSEEESASFNEQLPSILEYVSKLQAVDTSHIQVKAYLTDVSNVFRKDEVKNSNESLRNNLINSFPKQKGGALQVPGIFE